MIPTAAAARGPIDPYDQRQRHLMMITSSELMPTKDPVLSTLQNNTNNGIPLTPQQHNTNHQSLLTTLSNFNGQMNVSAEVLLQAMDPTYNKGGQTSDNGTIGVETMEWDEFDTQGQDMMQRVYQDRLQKVQQQDAKNQLPIQPNKATDVQQQRSPPLPQRGQMKELDIDSDDSDFGEQIKAKNKKSSTITKPSNNGRNMNRMSVIQQRGIPVGGTLPPGMTILDLDSSDDDIPITTNQRQTTTNQQQSITKQGPSVTRLIKQQNGGPQVISMSYKADHSTPLSQSMMGGGGMQLFGREMAFNDIVVEEEDENDEDELSDDSDFGPMTKQQSNKNNMTKNEQNDNKKPILPPRPAETPTHALTRTESPPPPPPMESPTNITRPQRPTVFGQNTTTTGMKSTAFGTTGGTTSGTGRMSIWDKAKGGDNNTTPTTTTQSGAPATTTGRMSIWDKAKNNTTTTNTTTNTTTTTGIGAKTTTTTLPAVTETKPTTTTTTNTTPAAPAVPANTTSTTTTTSSTTPQPSTQQNQRLTFDCVDIIPISLPLDRSTSGLFNQLNDSGFLRSYQRSKPEKSTGFSGTSSNRMKQGGIGSNTKHSGPTKNIAIRFQFNTSLLTVIVYPTMSVDEMIQECLNTYKSNNKEPQLPSLYSRDYNLFIWDEDEEDIDDDIPPFNRSQIISQLDTNSLCIVPDKDAGNNKIKQLEMEESLQQRSSQIYDEFDNNFDEFGNSPRNDPISPRNPSKSMYQRELSSLDLDRTDSLLSKNLLVGADTLTTLDAVSAFIHQLYSQMTPQIAGKPTQYKTYKINEKGKRQERYFGLDRYNIYNKTTPSSAFNTFSKLLNISKTERPIKSIIHVRVLPECLTTFQIDYKEDGSDTVTTRGYEVESVMICCEIVAKLRYLINNP